MLGLINIALDQLREIIGFEAEVLVVGDEEVVGLVEEGVLAFFDFDVAWLLGQETA